jgi:hypothetical protein
MVDYVLKLGSAGLELSPNSWQRGQTMGQGAKILNRSQVLGTSNTAHLYSGLKYVIFNIIVHMYLWTKPLSGLQVKD